MSELYVRREPVECWYAEEPCSTEDSGGMVGVVHPYFYDDDGHDWDAETFHAIYQPLAEYQRTQRDAVIRALIEKYVSVHDTDTDPVLSHNAWITANTLRAELGAEDAEQGVRHDPAS